MIKKAIKNHRGISFSVEDMVNTSGSFDLIFCATNTFQHLLDDKIALKTLINIKSSFKPKGKFILDIQNPNEIKLKRNLDLPYKYKDFIYEGKREEAYINGNYDRESSIYFFNINYLKDGANFKKKSVAMKMFRHKEMLQLISNSGFQIEKCYGCYSKSRYTSKSDKQIFILS